MQRALGARLLLLRGATHAARHGTPQFASSAIARLRSADRSWISLVVAVVAIEVPVTQIPSLKGSVGEGPTPPFELFRSEFFAKIKK